MRHKECSGQLFLRAAKRVRNNTHTHTVHLLLCKALSDSIKIKKRNEWKCTWLDWKVKCTVSEPVKNKERLSNVANQQQKKQKKKKHLHLSSQDKEANAILNTPQLMEDSNFTLASKLSIIYSCMQRLTCTFSCCIGYGHLSAVPKDSLKIRYIIYRWWLLQYSI